MALSVKDNETDRPRPRVGCTHQRDIDGRDPQGARRGLERERLRRGGPIGLADRLIQIGRHCAALSDLEKRSPDEIFGYDETGMWR